MSKNESLSGKAMGRVSKIEKLSVEVVERQTLIRSLKH